MNKHELFYKGIVSQFLYMFGLLSKFVRQQNGGLLYEE